MFFISRFSYALKILHISIHILRSHFFFITLLIIHPLLLCMSFCAFLTIEATWFDIHVLDFSIFEKILNFPTIRALFQVVVCFFSLCIMEFISISMAYATAYKMLSVVDNQIMSYKQLYTSYTKSLKELVRHSVIMACEHLKWVFSWTFITTHLSAFQDICDESYEAAVKKYQTPVTILLYPLLVENPGVMLKKIRFMSQELLEKKFDNHNNQVEKQYAFGCLTFGMVCAVWIILYILYAYRFINSQWALLLGIGVIVLYVSILKELIVIFEVAVYRYCIGGTSYKYPPSFLHVLFKPAEPANVITLSKK